MIDHVGDQLAGGGLGPDAGDKLAAGCAHHLDPDLGKALVELLDDLLFDFGEIRGVVDQLAFRFRRRDQFGRSEFLLRRCRRRVQRHAETGDTGECNNPGNDFSVHNRSSLDVILFAAQRCPGLPLATASSRRRSARRAEPSAPD
ncbi:MAG TPA: hypothetical protein VHQ48_16110 [Bradyrhizobium sp.]|nr:hypothetical protein [Bradyrhizobium sp.]